ncbi:hypothetical protein CCR75_006504 [Bremia lactucae]|uniref:Uncharacterized protein n=1 Tax=Bremia lactucae TaxID=4779 RepID=A0A976IB35_BRELC|nr:hypothetical protein CCR75_006504 [Bremia lactucae]
MVLRLAKHSLKTMLSNDLVEKSKVPQDACFYRVFRHVHLELCCKQRVDVWKVVVLHGCTTTVDLDEHVVSVTFVLSLCRM